MKVALVHDWLNIKFGGAERVLLEMAEMFPKAPIYTLVYNKEVFGDVIDPKRVRTSYLQRAPQFLKNRSKYLLPLIPGAIEGLDLKGYDLVLSNSGAYSKNVIIQPGTYHICYCHSPMRFAWDYWPQYLHDLKVGPLRRFVVRKMVSHLRLWDQAGTARVDDFIANSKNIQRRISKFYRRGSSVIYAPVDLPPVPKVKKEDYYVTVSALSRYKKIDLLIEAFAVSGKKLLIVGDGPERAKLEKLAPANIGFTGYVSDKEKWRHLARARGFLFAHEEDFGIAPIEAMACGTPVIALAKGGVLETVSHLKTGVLFRSPTPKEINEAIVKAEKMKFDKKLLRARAERFSKTYFRRNLAAFIKEHFDARSKS